MGVSVSVWRARCGLYQCRLPGRHPQKSQGTTQESSHGICILVAFLVTMLLLVAGDVEENPGPGVSCRVCNQTFSTLGTHKMHQRLHAHDHNFAFYCPLCPLRSFKTYSGLDIHVSYNHRNTKQCTSLSNFCHCIVSGCAVKKSSVSELISHFDDHFKKSETVLCIFGGCKHEDKPFSKLSTYRTHLSNYHSNWRATAVPTSVLRKETPDVETHEEDHCEMHEEDLPYVEDDIESAENTGSDPLESGILGDDDLVVKTIAQLYLMLEAESLVPASTVQTFCTSLTFISEIVQARFKETLFRKLKDVLPEDEINLLCYEVLKGDPLYSTHHKNAPGPNLTSIYLRTQFYKKYFGFKEPVEVNLSADPESKYKVYCAPIRYTLTEMLKDPSIQQQIDESFERRSTKTDDKISDYTDGTFYKSQNPTMEQRIELILFQDGFSVVNPIGAVKKVYKILGTYFTIGNLKPHLRSKLNAIRLACVFREKFMKCETEMHPFEPLLTELKSLETEGITYKNRIIYVVVQFILGDNLGSHMIVGFLESFRAHYFCRFCEMTSKAFKSVIEGQWKAYTYSLRSKADYIRSVLRVTTHNLKNYKGIKRDSEFNCLTNFHASEQLPPCLAHDLFEGGVVDCDLARIIKTLVNDLKWLSYDWLNRKIESFDYKSRDVRNKPAPVREDHGRVGGHAVQNWTLLRLLPLIIHDKIKDKSAPAWKLYLALKDLCECLCAPSFTVQSLNYLEQVVIPNYMALRIELYGADTLKPKHHFMCHYPKLIHKFGPVFYLWTLRFESFHSLSKQIARHGRNYINVEKSIAYKHQLRTAYLGTGEIVPQRSQIEEGKLFQLEKICPELAREIKSLHLSPESLEVNSMNANGLKFSVDDVVVLKQISSVELKIGTIVTIIVSGCNIYLVMKTCSALLNNQTGLFELTDDETDYYVKPSSAIEGDPLQPVYNLGDKKVFSLKFKYF